jgi:hypothetical protein
VGPGEDAPGLVQPRQQRRGAASTRSARQALAGGDFASPFNQMLDPEQLALDRTRDQLLSGVGAAEAETSEDLSRAERSDGADLR